MGKLFIKGFKGKIVYAQLLHDASEVQIVKGYGNPIMTETIHNETLILGLPIIKPELKIPVIEVFLKPSNK